VTTANKTGFNVAAIDASEGKVAVETVYCSWVACQFAENK
jgi:hypothetical protein